MWNLGERKIYASVTDYHNRIMIHIQHYGDDRGKPTPTEMGVTLQVHEWVSLKAAVNEIDFAICDLIDNRPQAIEVQPDNKRIHPRIPEEVRNIPADKIRKLNRRLSSTANGR